MRTVLALCLIALISTSFASHTKVKSSNKAFFQSLEGHALLKGIKGLAQLAEDDDFREVRRVVEAIRDQIVETLANYEEEYASEEEVYESDRDNAISQIRSLQNSLEETRVALEGVNEIIDQLTGYIQASQAVIEDAEYQKDNEEARRVAVHQAFREHYAQLQEAAEAVEEALKLVIEIGNEDLGSSFIQVGNKKIQKAAKKIHHIMKHLGISTHAKTYAETFLEVTAEGVNQDTVDAITTLLVTLGEQIEAHKDDAVERDNADDEYSRSVLANLDSTIDTETNSIEQNSATLNANLEEAAFLEDSERTLAGYLDNAVENLQSLEESWESKSERYEGIIRRLKGDINALNAADQFLDA